jgi:hypothetical protein
MEMPTSVQAFPHGLSAHIRNAAKRAAPLNFWRYVVGGCFRDWQRLSESLLSCAVSEDGVFHLWGHSWEIEEVGEWQRLEWVVATMGGIVAQVQRATNGNVCLDYARCNALQSTAATKQR